ncbi:MAG: hypothetical protein AAGE05_15285 [Pseudomonadota bacterium]
MDDPVDTLRAKIAAFDGRAVSILGEIEAAESDMAGYMDALITLAADDGPNIAAGATWLVKSALERGRRLSAAQVSALAARLDGIAAWDAQLHICQSIRHLEIDAAAADGFVGWLRPLTRHDRPFLRAWSLDALCHVAAVSGAHAQAAQRSLAVALADSAASVRARARALSR